MDTFTNLSSAAPVNQAIAFTSSILALIVLTAVIFVLALRAGRALLVALILSLYVGFALYTFFPYADQLTAASGSTANAQAIASIALYAVFSGIAYFAIRRISGGGMGGIRTLPLFVLALLTGGFLLALGYHSFSLGEVYAPSAVLKSIFVPPQYFFWWFIAPLAGLFFIGR